MYKVIQWDNLLKYDVIDPSKIDFNVVLSHRYQFEYILRHYIDKYGAAIEHLSVIFKDNAIIIEYWDKIELDYVRLVFDSNNIELDKVNHLHDLVIGVMFEVNRLFA